ncbi:MAG: transcription termination/antitermination protein NusA [Bacteroidales bacterium]|jgi:N utilization substance protein A|nr:transcription termination/antitermination protein NusA [Bacteroidales bacterium]
MEGLNLVSTFAEFKEGKNIDKPTLMSVLEEAFRAQLEKMYGEGAKFDITVNIDNGDFEIWRTREVVEEVEDPATEISLEEVSKIDDSYDVGEDYMEKVELSQFGRRGILNIRQNLAGRIMDIDNANLFNKYKERIGEIIVGQVHQSWKKETIIHDEDKNELVLPKTEQIPSDFFRKDDTVKAIISNVEMRNNKPVITLSRTSNLFLEKLFEQEVPEIFDGLITIKKVVRIPGERAKVAVESYDDRIDPVGACVGVKGSRIHGIVKELHNENIDVINWTNNKQLLIQRALSPAKISSMEFDEANKTVNVYLKPSEVSVAIGKGGCNIKLAGMLIDYQIEAYREVDEAEAAAEEEDVLLDDFSDEIDTWVIDALKAIGLDTAKSVLALPVEEISKRADLEDETVVEVQRILRSEFE